MSDHVVELLSNAFIFFTLLLGIWNNNRNAKKAALQGKLNETKIQDLHNAVNGVLATDRADTKTESDRLLKESTSAARAEGVIQGRADITKK